jgi:hypothetical protein
MTRRPDLGGPIIIVAVVAIVASIAAGLWVVGGPGTARDRRLDKALQMDVRRVANIAHCAYLVSGDAPSSIDDGFLTLRKSPDAAQAAGCSYFEDTAPSNVSYERLSENGIRVCATFLRSISASAARRPYYGSDTFPELRVERESGGPHCYDVTLTNVRPESGEYVENPFGPVH